MQLLGAHFEERLKFQFYPSQNQIFWILLGYLSKKIYIEFKYIYFIFSPLTLSKRVREMHFLFHIFSFLFLHSLLSVFLPLSYNQTHY